MNSHHYAGASFFFALIHACGTLNLNLKRKHTDMNQRSRAGDRLYEFKKNIRKVLKKMNATRDEYPSMRIRKARQELASLLNKPANNVMPNVQYGTLLKKLQETVRILNEEMNISGLKSIERAYQQAKDVLIHFSRTSNSINKKQQYGDHKND
tara:strand:+ start:106 stop:564 length:459 start_codon:yes stop_codon:yes gene_type:complete